MIKPSPKGFTLVELTIILAVFATIATLVVTGYLQAQKSGKTAENIKRATEIATAAENYLILTMPNRHYPTKTSLYNDLVDEDKSFLDLFTSELRDLISFTDVPDINNKERLKFLNCFNHAGAIAGVMITYWDHNTSETKNVGTGRYEGSDIQCL